MMGDIASGIRSRLHGQQSKPFILVYVHPCMVTDSKIINASHSVNIFLHLAVLQLTYPVDFSNRVIFP